MAGCPFAGELLEDGTEDLGADGVLGGAPGRLCPAFLEGGEPGCGDELVDALSTGDRTEDVRSSADLPRLGLLVEWAKKARLVRVAKGRLYAVARARPVLAGPLQLWLRAFDACFELRQALIGARSGWHVESMLFDVYEDVLEDVLNTLYSLPYPMPWPRLRDSVHLAYRARFQLDGGSDLRHRMWFEHADRDLRTVLDVLDDLGTIERDQGMADPVFLDVDLSDAGPELPADMPPELAELLGVAGAAADPAAAQERADARRAELTTGPVELIRLTELGTRAVRQRLPAAGRGGAEEALRAQGTEAGEAVAAALDSAHPDRAGLDELRELAARALRSPTARTVRSRKRGRPTGKNTRKRRR